MTVESQVQSLVAQTQALDFTVKSELLDTNKDVTALRARVTALEIRVGMPEESTGGIPGGGGGSPSNPATTPGTTTIGNDVIQIDAEHELLWLWNPDTKSWVSIPFSEIAPPIALDIQAILNQANSAIDAGIAARIDALAASITDTVLETQQTQIDGLASQLTTLGTTVNGHTSAIQTEQTARANADSALASNITDLVAQVDSNHQAFVAFQSAVAADPSSASAQLLNQIQSQVAANTAAIQNESTTRAAGDSSMAGQISTLVSSVNTAQAAVQQEVNARTTADNAISTSVTNLASRVGTAEGAIQSLQTVTSGLDSNVVSNITTLTSSVNNLTTTVQDTATAVNGVLGRRTLAINANGKVTGIELLGGGTVGSQIKFQASNFIFYDPTTSVETAPFVISGGATYINKAVIKNADIDTLKIAGNSVTVPARFSFGQASGTGSTFTGSFTMPDAGSVMIVVSMTLPNDNSVYRLDNGTFEANPSPLPSSYPVSVSTNMRLSIDGTQVYNEAPNNGFGNIATFVGSAAVSSGGTKSFSLTVQPYGLPSFVNGGLIPRNIVVYVFGACR